jgi:hypothetical protein
MTEIDAPFNCSILIFYYFLKIGLFCNSTYVSINFTCEASSEEIEPLPSDVSC